MSRVSGSAMPRAPIAPCRHRYTPSTCPAARRPSTSRASSVSKQSFDSGPPDDAHADSTGTGSARPRTARTNPASSARLKKPFTSGPSVTALRSASPLR
jgi:hypothetical protein